MNSNPMYGVFMITKPMIRIITFQRGNRFALLREIVTTSCHFADNQRRRRRRRGSKTKQKRKKTKQEKKTPPSILPNMALHPARKQRKRQQRGEWRRRAESSGWCCFLTCQWSCGGYGTNGQDTAPPPLVSPQDTTTLPCSPQTCEQMSVSGPGGPGGEPRGDHKLEHNHSLTFAP